MPFRKVSYLIPIVLGMLILTSLLWIWPASRASAQCGSQASSCKNCHEVQMQKPVNNDGNGWHTGHAFGDFCNICHAGNSQAATKEAAHAGMVAPLSDVKAACSSCHVQDYNDRAKIYAAKLGVPIGAGASPSGNATPEATVAAPAAGSEAPAAPGKAPLALGSAADPQSLVDYVKQYNENVLGQKPTNWGNIILMVLIGAMVIGGGSLVVTREGLIRVSFRETKPLEGEFPADVVALAPEIARLKPSARQSLHRLLKKPAATADLLASLDQLTQGDLSDPQE